MIYDNSTITAACFGSDQRKKDVQHIQVLYNCAMHNQLVCPSVRVFGLQPSRKKQVRAAHLGPPDRPLARRRRRRQRRVKGTRRAAAGQWGRGRGADRPLQRLEQAGGGGEAGRGGGEANPRRAPARPLFRCERCVLPRRDTPRPTPRFPA